MTAAQKRKALAYLEERIAQRERSVAQLRHDAVAMNDETMLMWAALVEDELDTLRATLALVEHYTPVDNSAAETTRIEVPA
jgi:hypothetical protein